MGPPYRMRKKSYMIHIIRLDEALQGISNEQAVSMNWKTQARFLMLILFASFSIQYTK